MSTSTACDRCRRPFSYAIARSDNPDQALCVSCCARLRAGGAWGPAAKIPVKTIEILWTEADSQKRPAFDSWADVDTAMFFIGASVKGGGYHKTGFRVTWADGETYEGRIDARPGRTNIREHMRDYCLYHSGRAVPWHRTAEQWAAYLNECVKPERRAALAFILDTYQIDS